jgi:stress-induced morphogen
MKIQPAIESALSDSFKPVHLQVANESHMHSVPKDSETHFKVVIVSEAFTGKRLVQRHQQVYTVLTEWLQNGIHALALHTYTPQEWSENTEAPASPNCMGGSKKG